MGIQVSKGTDLEHGDEVVQLTLTGPSVNRFRKLLAKGMNTWDQAHPELKELHDLVVVGNIQQDYRGQGYKPREE